MPYIGPGNIAAVTVSNSTTTGSIYVIDIGSIDPARWWYSGTNGGVIITNSSTITASSLTPLGSFVQPLDEEQFIRDRRRERAQRRLAKRRSEQILTDHLSAEQRRDLAQFGYFKLYLKSKDGVERIYRIRRGSVRNVDAMTVAPDGSLMPIGTLCAHPSLVVPDADTMLIQKLMLEGCEEEFLRIANKMMPVPEALV